MNPDDIHYPALVADDAEEGNVPTADTNANDLSKGAIPKKTRTPPQKKYTNTKQALKLNNNIESMSTLNSENGLRINGLTNSIASNFYPDLEPSCSSYDKGDSSSDEENDLLSVSDDGCIYTYKGDHAADLPSSFFALDIPPEIPEPLPRNETSSPEMDYLEMDFDPGINGDNDSNSEADNEAGSISKLVIASMMVEQPEPVITPVPSTSGLNGKKREEDVPVFVPSTLRPIEQQTSVQCVPKKVERVARPSREEIEKTMPWSCSLAQRTRSINFRMSKRCHCSRGELISPSENVPLIKGASVPAIIAAEIENGAAEVESFMIWNKEDAHLKQITQIGPSACGATAVLNVLNALRFPIPTLDRIKECVQTRLRKNNSALPEYLKSRSVAGTTHEDLIAGLDAISNGTIYARFFHMYPERVLNLYSWLTFWMKNGAVPIATLNLQRCAGTIPDAWHHQMIFGVDANGVHLTNPFECVDAGLLWPQLCSESVLLVRREDVISRWNYRTDLPELMKIKDIRWRRINVVGQVANMIHESGRELRPGFTNTSHIRIPAAYSSGITLAMNTNSSACDLLKTTPELPLLDPYEAIAANTYSSMI